MKTFNFKITDYSIHLGERAESSPPGYKKDGPKVTVTAVMTCRGQAGERVIVNFYKPTADVPGPLPSTAHLGDEGKPTGLIWEDEANFLHFVDLVRNESPIWGYVERVKETAEVRLYTGHWEPVGVGDEDYASDPTR